MRPLLKDNSNISWWYRQNSLLYVHKDLCPIFENQSFKAVKKPQYYRSEEYCDNLGREVQRLNTKLNKTLSRRLKRIINKIRGKH